MSRVITLPNGKPCTVGTYVRAWQTLKKVGPDDARLWPGFFDFPEPARDILAAMERGMHERINARVPYVERGRAA